MNRVGLVLFGALALGCHRRTPLGSATLGAASLASRTTMPKDLGGATFDERLQAEPTGLVSFSLEPRSMNECIERLDRSKLHATANGAPMKLESAGGSHVEHPMGSSHFPTTSSRRETSERAWSLRTARRARRRPTPRSARTRA